MSDLISRKDAIDAMMALKHEDDEIYGCEIPEGFDGQRAVEALEKLPSAEPDRKFLEIVAEYPKICTYPEYEGKPYYSIKYEENGETIVGFGTYKPEVLSQYLKDYFIPSAEPERKFIVEGLDKEGADMKTLNEVIAELEDEKVFADALHYLREYRSDMKLWESDRKGFEAWIEQYKEARDKHQQAVIDMAKNPPLSWEELKTMEGKPVWVEVLSDEIDLSSRWMLVARETKAHSLPLAYTDDICHWFYVHEDKLGKAWQAYRKERE